MTHPRLVRLEPHLLPLSLVLGAAVFYLGLGWGLPSRDVDAFIFGGRPAAAGLGVVSLSSSRPATLPIRSEDLPSGDKGADLDQNPLARPADRMVVLNADVAGQAEIIRRYRLFSYQPDEMITFMSLAKMRPGVFDFDPRLYQYGGLWIYPVGLGLRIAAGVGFLDLKGGVGGLAHYLNEPEAFARFYVVARLYVMAWALIGVWSVFAIARSLSGRIWIAFGTAVAFICLPVVVNASHEAKPHLPGMVLTLLTVLAAARWTRTGATADAVLTGGMCGLAVGMVLSTLPVLAVLPTMVMLRADPWRTKLKGLLEAASAVLGAYALTNPYVIYHLVSGDVATLRSNLGNSKSFYEVGRIGEGALNVLALIAEGMSLPAAVLAATALGWVVIRSLVGGWLKAFAGRSRLTLAALLAVPAALNALQAALVGAGKPGEFGRFLLLTDVSLLIGLFAVLAAAPRYSRAGLSVLFVLLPIWWGGRYLAGFVRDSQRGTSRLKAAEDIERLRRAGGKRLILSSEPAPYVTPPFNLFDWPVLLTPKNADPRQFAESGDVVIQILAGGTPISWADRRFEVWAAQ